MTTDPTQLTDRQFAVLQCIYRLTASGNPPTFRDLMRELSVTSPNGVQCHLDSLERKGWLYIDGDGTGYRRSRGIRLKGMQMKPTFTFDAAGERLRAAIETAGNLEPVEAHG
jgi:SOS-response transcriptional repressor LexA